MFRSKYLLLLAISLLAALSAAAPAVAGDADKEPPAQGAVDPFAAPATEEARAAGDRLALEMLAAHGGLARYEAVRLLSFDFVVHLGERRARRHHDWDRHAGLAHVVETKDKKRVEAWLRLADKSGVVTVDGARVTDAAERKERLERAYALWVNDTYWLCAPYKVMDPGVVRVAVGGDLRLSFEGVGLTPGDAYLLHLDDKKRLAGWDFLLQSKDRGSFTWEEPREVFGTTFFLSRKSAAGTISFERFAASLEGSDGVFAPLLEGGAP